MRTLNYIWNKMMTSKKLNEKLLDKIIHDLRQEMNAYWVGGNYMPQSIMQQKIGDSYWVAFSFAEKEIELLKDNNISIKISAPMAEIYDHDTAEIIREFCRSRAAKIAIRILPSIPLFHISHLCIIFHYDFCLPDIDYTRRIYVVSIYMDRLRSLRIKDLNKENIRNYFELENSQIRGLFPEWKDRGVLMRPDVNEMI
jgi:hypothetical protein